MLVHGIDGLVDSWSAQFSRNRLAALQEAGSIDFVWHLGDVGYADDSFAHSPLDLSYETAYNGFQDWMQNLSARCPYMVSPGNHESECHSPECLTHIDSIGKPLANFTAYNARWHMPSLESGARARQSMWYSWDYGGVHFVSINSETDWPGAEEEKTGDGHFKSLPAGSFGQAGEYLAWLRADLTQAATSREKTGWPRYIVAGGHRPYSDIQPLHTDLFAEFGVDLYVAGHAHSYKRYEGALNGTQYVVVGGAGCDEMADGKPDLEANWAHPLQGSGAFDYFHYATGLLTVNETGLHWSLVDSRNGTVVDHVTVKSAPSPRP